MGPIIGLTSDLRSIDGTVFSSINYEYVDAIINAGGIPIVLPIVKKEKKLDSYINTIDGLIFTGGEDVSPLFYDENPISEIGIVSIDRDEYEIELFKSAYNNHLPIMGICRGMQLINVALGGTLYQDINVQVKGSLGHRSPDKNLRQPHHKIKIIEDSKHYTIFKNKEIEVNSFHHQSIKKIGKNLKAVAHAYDGIIEGIESTNSNFVLGLQWHPERMICRYPKIKELFHFFVSICK